MKMDKIKTIIGKEWAEVFKNRWVFFSVLFMPLIFAIMPLVTLATTNSFTEELTGDVSTETPADVEASDDDSMTAFAGELCTGLNESDCVQVYMISIFTLLFMMVPLIVPVTIAAYSVVGEKTTRSLEPLLATPITTIEFLIGKAAAAVIPAVVATWVGFGIYLVGAFLMAEARIFSYIIDPLWMIAIFIDGPLLALLSVNIALMISSRVTEPRAAEQLAGFVVLPVVLLLMGQSFGWILISQELIIIIGVVTAVLDASLFYFTIKLFQRETILTRWK
jgi:ABC-2 type transport system permease protein